MNGVNKTLYIPLYGKAYVSKKGIILNDKTAEKIWEKEGFELKGKSKSKWLAYYMGMRSAVFDNWLKAQMEEDEEIKRFAAAYSSAAMKPKQAAGIFESMTDNLDLVAKILNAMSADDRGAILGVMDPDVAARLTKLMDPEA